MKPVKIIIGQEDSNAPDAFGTFFTDAQFDVIVVNGGQKVLSEAKKNPPPDLLVLQHNLTRPDPAEVCQTLKSNPATATIPVMFVISDTTAHDAISLSKVGFDDILVQPTRDVFKARVQALLKLKNLFNGGEEDTAAVLYTLTRTIEAKDLYTMGHADRVGHFAVDLGRALGMSLAELETLRKGGILHDIGKIAIPDSILTKPGKYTPEEFAVMKRHPILGCEICEKLSSLKDALPIIRHHHEKLDGSGYPDGLGGAQIPVNVRIVSIVDIYDALRSKRSYKDAFSIDKSFEIMWEEANKGWWDKDILTVWEKHVRANQPSH